MVGRIFGLVLATALVGGVFIVSQPSNAAPGACGPTTLVDLFPDLDVDGQPTTTVPAPPTTTTVEPSSSTSVSDVTTTTTVESSTTTTIPGSETTTTGGSVVPSTTAPAPTPPTTKPCPTWIYEMQFPLASEARVVSGFGADRDGGSRRHKGTDILAPRLTPVLAVADGVVGSVHSNPPGDCCWLTIRHTDGWQSLYLHLNNDSYQTDDGLGHGIVPGLEAGDQVTAGQVVGWVGDSGNAEGTVPHLHFELRHPEGYSVDAAPSVNAAKRATELPPFFGPYVDDDGLSIERLTSRLVADGAYWPCGDTGIEVCPDQLAQPAETSQLIGLLTGISPPLVETSDQTLSIAETISGEFVNDVTGCEIVKDCLQQGITAGDVARLVTWTLQMERLGINTEVDPIADMALPTVTGSENALRFLGIIGICHEPVDATTLLTRADVLRLVNWWVLGESPISCVQSAGPER